ncbi:MAG: electron transfer flavoprotein subunit beta/FixA family protein [Chitinophagales bacterium]
MRWIVCIKQVPGTINVQVDRQTNNLVREGIPGIINPFDLNALEAALELRDNYGGRVTAVTMGPPQAIESLRDALAMGADEAVLLCDQKFRGADTLATSYTLAEAIKRLAPYRLIICGKQAIDGDTAQVGPEIAEWLGLPQLTGLSRIELNGETLIGQKDGENGFDRMEVELPALVTVDRLNEPRIPSVDGRLRANRSAITVWTARDLGLACERIGLEGSPTRVVKVFQPDHTRLGKVRTGSPEELSKWLIESLIDRGFINNES